MSVRSATEMLRPEHAEHLAKFRIPLEIIQAAGLRSVTDTEARETLGLHGYKSACLNGILFPYLSPLNGARFGGRIRLDHSLPDGGKYISELGCRHFFFPPRVVNFLDDLSVPVVIVEAEKSALSIGALADRVGRQMLPVGIGGCWGWKRKNGNRILPNGGTEPDTGPSPDFDLITWQGRSTILAFDSNAANNSNVQSARRALAQELTARGANVLIATVPAIGGVNGPDDLIATLADKAMLDVLDGAQPVRKSQACAADDWPKPEPIQSELPPVEAFSENLLPVSFRSLVSDVAERMQVPMDYPAAVMVLCLAGAVNRRAVIQPKAHDTGWLVVPNLWGGIIAPPGFMKSPVIQNAIRPLNQIQTDWRLTHEEARKDFARAKEEYELRLASWKEQYKASDKKRISAPSRPDDVPEEPKLRRLIVNDATFEALHQTMSENPAGILVIRDELTGWWSTLDRAGREGERAFSLQAWNGDTGHTIDRIGRGTIHVEACCMSMLGGIQPGRLRSYLVDALEDGPSNDGLIQRFQVLVWPDTEPGWTYVDRPPNTASEEQAARAFRKLVELDAANPKRFRFTPEAQELLVEWLKELELKVRGDELHPALISHLSKYRKLMPALALLFELASQAAVDGETDTVSLEHARMAAAWCDYLESHARRVYSCVVTPQLRAARELLDKIRKRKVGAGGFFSCRDVYLKGWSGLDSPEAVKLAAEVLEDAGWVRNVETTSGPLGGRPSNRYAVNPRIQE